MMMAKVAIFVLLFGQRIRRKNAWSFYEIIHIALIIMKYARLKIRISVTARLVDKCHLYQRVFPI